MRPLIILLTVTLAFVLTERAKEVMRSHTERTGSTETTAGPQATKQSPAAPGDRGKAGASLSGCLDKKDGGKGFVLVNSERSVEVQSDQDLGAHIGHQVKLEGRWEKQDTGKEGGTKGYPAEGKEGGKEGGTKGRVFKATKIEDRSDTCLVAKP